MAADGNGNGNIAETLSALIRAKYAAIGIESREEARVESVIAQVAENMPAPSAPFALRFWSCTDGVTDLNGEPIGDLGSVTGPAEILDVIRKARERSVWVLRDFHHYLSRPGVLRALRDTAKRLRRSQPESARCILLLSPRLSLHEDIEADVTMLRWPLPRRDDLDRVITSTIESLQSEQVKEHARQNLDRDAVVSAALGLTIQEATASFARSLVERRTLDWRVVMAQKKEIVKRSGALEWLDTLPGGLDDVGGLEVLRQWLIDRAEAWSPEASTYQASPGATVRGLPRPKGVILAGVQGCGKTYIAKAIGSTWRLPAVRLNMASIFGEHVGESEQRLRMAFEIIDLLGRCIVLIDEMDKALGDEDGESDGQTTKRVKGEMLTWLQERKSEAFVVAAMNKVEAISARSPELLRKGRWNELFFIDLPHAVERQAQILIHAKANGIAVASLNMPALVAATDGFSGAEIEAIVAESLFRGFKDGRRPVETRDILAEAQTLVPQSRSAKPAIDALRAWAKGRARMASLPPEANVAVPTLEVA